MGTRQVVVEGQLSAVSFVDDIASGTKYLALFYIRAGVRWAQ